MSKFGETSYDIPISKMAMGLKLVVEHNTEVEKELRTTRNLCMDLFEEVKEAYLASCYVDEWKYDELREQMIKLELIGETDG